ncbi:MAG: dockerin type I domain-containing protein [Porcipelethomonas sp.]
MKTIKKFLSIATATLCFISVFMGAMLPLNVRATEYAGIAVGDVEVGYGTTSVSVPLSLVGDISSQGCVITVYYDSPLYIESMNSALVYDNSVSGAISATYVSPSGLRETFEYLEVEIDSDAQPGTYPLDLVISSLDNNGSYVDDPVAIGGSVTIYDNNVYMPSLSLSDVTCLPGETVTMYLSAATGNDLECVDCVLEYDDELTASKAVSVAPGFTCASAVVEGFVSIVGFTAGDAIRDGEIASVEFTVPESASAGDVYEIGFSSVNTFATVSGGDTDVALSSGTITVLNSEEWSSDPEIYLSGGINKCSLMIDSDDCEAYKVIVKYNPDSMQFDSIESDYPVIFDNSIEGELIISGFTAGYFNGNIADINFICSKSDSVELEVINFGTDGENYPSYSYYGCTVESESGESNIPVMRICSVEGADHVYAEPGSEFIAYINIDSSDCDAYKISVIYPEGLEFDGLDNSQGFSVYSEKNGEILVSGFTDDYFSGNVAGLRFTVSDSASEGDELCLGIETINFGADGKDYSSYETYTNFSAFVTEEKPTETTATTTSVRPAETETTVTSVTTGYVSDDTTPVSTTSPAGTTTKPVSVSVPAGTTTKPVSTTSAGTTTKSVSTTLPAGTTTKSVSTTLPAGTTTKPVSTTSPAGTTTKSVSTTSPAGTTTSPQQTQTSPAVNGISLEPGEKVAIYIPDVPEDVKYVSMNRDVAEVDGNGIVYGVGDGETQIYIISGSSVVNIIDVVVKSSYIRGDVNLDGEVSVFDAIAVARYTVGKVVLTSQQLTAADVTGDGNADVFDAVMIAKHTVGVPFPWE